MIGVELTQYHGGSLNGKDIKTVTDNVTHVFNEGGKILCDGKQRDSINSVAVLVKCEQFKAAFLLWDGAFSIAQKVNPDDADLALYRRFVNAAVESHREVGCNITHKVHLMLKHVEGQTRSLPRGLGDKMEDWVELMHQWGMRLRRRLRTVKDPLVRANTRAKVLQRDTNPAVVAYSEAVQDGARRNMKNQKKLRETLRKEERERNRLGALGAYKLAKGLVEVMATAEVAAGVVEAAAVEDMTVLGG